MNNNRLTIVSFPVEIGFGGGPKREFFVLQHFLKYLEIELHIPFRYIVEILFIKSFIQDIAKNVRKSLEKLNKKGLNIPQYFFYILENEKLQEKILKSVSYRGKIPYILSLEKFEYYFIKKILCENELNPANSMFIYTPHELLEYIYPTYYLATKYEKTIAILLQEAPFLNLYAFFNSMRYSLKFSISRKYHGIKNKKLITSLNNSGKLLKILSVSISPIILSHLNKYIPNHKIRILKIGNAFDKKLLKYRTFRKKNYLVFFARLVPEKGIFEIPYVINEVKKDYEDVKIYVIGNFNNTVNKIKFLKLTKKLKLEENISLLGFLENKKLYRVVSKAKAVIYPSHQDSYSLVTLESLALGTSVVAYNIPAVISIYRNLKPVKIVREGDIKEMSKKITEILNQDRKEYKNEHQDEKVREFLKLHSSWKNVALEEIRELGFKI